MYIKFIPIISPTSDQLGYLTLFLSEIYKYLPSGYIPRLYSKIPPSCEKTSCAVIDIGRNSSGMLLAIYIYLPVAVTGTFVKSTARFIQHTRPYLYILLPGYHASFLIVYVIPFTNGFSISKSYIPTADKLPFSGQTCNS